MPRPRQFDKNDALDKMVGIFWRKGYASTSIQDLEEATRLSRPSLYAAFGGKEALFLSILRRYQHLYNGHLMTALRGPGPVRHVLQNYFDRFVDQLCDDRLPPGCLLANSVIEFGPDSEAIGRFVRDQLMTIEGELYRILRRGQAEGDIGIDIDVKALARTFTALAEGMALLSRGGFGKSALREIVSSGMATLGTDAPARPRQKTIKRRASPKREKAASAQS